MKFTKGETVIYPQHGACVVKGTKKMEAFGEKREYLILETVINEMVLKVPVDKADEVGVRPPVSPDELEDLVSVLAKPDPRVPSNWSRRFKNHQEKLKSGDVYQVAEVVRNLAARNRDAALSAAERTMYERARVNLISEIAPALKVSAEAAEDYLDDALAKGVLSAGGSSKASAGAADSSSSSAKKEPAKKPPAKKAAAEKPAKKTAAKKSTAKKAAAAKPAKKAAAKKATAKKTAAKK
ncbi:MAG: CarD family transcriptional regulator [Ilumatobacteraceae bacterium]